MKTVERDGIGKVDPVHYFKLYDRLYFSTNPNTPPETLTQLAEDEDLYVRRNVARHPNTPPETLTQLAEDENWEVRESVANKLSTLPELLIQLAEDDDFDVRRCVAGNPNTPPETLTQLAEDEEHFVSVTANQHPTYLQHRAEQDGVCAEGVKLPVEWLKQMYLTETCK